jgi:hypothetical protein
MAVDLVIEGLTTPPETKRWAVRLVQLTDGIEVEVNSDTDSWSILKLKNDGTFYLYEDVGEDSGFMIHKGGRIVESVHES